MSVNKRIHKMLLASLSACIIISNSIMAYAKIDLDIDENISIQKPVQVYSSEYPNAYIVVTSENDLKNKVTTNAEKNNKELNGITATVFVEETYKFVNGEKVVTDSRLLSKEEVNKYGVNSFKNLNSVQAKKSSSSKKGKLTITFNGSYSKKGKGVTASLKGNAKWSGIGASTSKNPACGDDFFGITWAGGFEASNTKCNVTTTPATSIAASLASADPNVGRVYSFQEWVSAGGKYTIYASNIDISTKLSKKKLTGSGNTAEAVLQYTHTYQVTTGSASINASGAGFSLSNTPKQWSITCVVNGIPY